MQPPFPTTTHLCLLCFRQLLHELLQACSKQARARVTQGTQAPHQISKGPAVAAVQQLGLQQQQLNLVQQLGHWLLLVATAVAVLGFQLAGLLPPGQFGDCSCTVDVVQGAAVLMQQLLQVLQRAGCLDGLCELGRVRRLQQHTGTQNTIMQLVRCLLLVMGLHALMCCGVGPSVRLDWPDHWLLKGCRLTYLHPCSSQWSGQSSRTEGPPPQHLMSSRGFYNELTINPEHWMMNSLRCHTLQVLLKNADFATLPSDLPLFACHAIHSQVLLVCDA